MKEPSGSFHMLLYFLITRKPRLWYHFAFWISKAITAFQGPPCTTLIEVTIFEVHCVLLNNYPFCQPHPTSLTRGKTRLSFTRFFPISCFVLAIEQCLPLSRHPGHIPPPVSPLILTPSLLLAKNRSALFSRRWSFNCLPCVVIYNHRWEKIVQFLVSAKAPQEPWLIFQKLRYLYFKAFMKHLPLCIKLFCWYCILITTKTTLFLLLLFSRYVRNV